MTITVNGVEVRYVGSFGTDTFRVIDAEGNARDFMTDRVDIRLTGKEIDYNLPIKCTYHNSLGEFIGAEGRFICDSITDDGIIRLIQNVIELDWIEVKVDTKDVQGVRDIVHMGDGRILIDIGKAGLGNISNDLGDQLDIAEGAEELCCEFGIRWGKGRKVDGYRVWDSLVK